MGLILAIYTNDAYQEVHLPLIDNADYDLLLRANAYGLRRDIHIFMDVLELQWRFKASSDYVVMHSRGEFRDTALEPGQILQIEAASGDTLAVLVLASPQELSASSKFRILGNTISIGKAEDCDICYPSQSIISQHHAQLQIQNGRCVITDTSTNGTYVGNLRMHQSRELQFGDLINLYGLSVIYLGDILSVSCLDGQVYVNPDKLEILSFPEEPKTAGKKEEFPPSEKIVHISPRVIPKLFEGEERIDNVPQKREEDHKPAWMSILPSFTMMLPMMLGYSLMSSGNMGMGIFITGGSAVVGTAWAIINLRYTKKENREKEQKRLTRYEEYLIQSADRIRDKFEFNRRALLEMYPDAAVCSSYTGDSAEIWTRSKQYSDFLYVRLGLGEIPFQVKISVPHQGFSMIDDELADRPENLAKNFETMRDVPLGVNLGEHSVVGVLTGSDRNAALNMSRVMIAQLAATHSPADVKLVALYDENSEHAREWSYVRWLPHVWNEERTMRYVASNESEINDVLYSLAQILRNRAESAQSGFGAPKAFYPHYVILVEKPEMLESQMISKYLYESGAALGVTTVILASSYEKLPSECSFIIQDDEKFRGMQ